MNATIKRIGGNLFEVSGTGDYEGVTVLVSYETPVAYVVGSNRAYAERTSTRFSRSTEAHLSDWASYCDTVPQSSLDDLLKQMTGDSRLRGKATASKLGRTVNTDGVNGHTEQGDRNLVVPVGRRRW